MTASNLPLSTYTVRLASVWMRLIILQTLGVPDLILQVIPECILKAMKGSNIT